MYVKYTSKDGHCRLVSKLINTFLLKAYTQLFQFIFINRYLY